MMMIVAIENILLCIKIMIIRVHRLRMQKEMMTSRLVCSAR